ncbi:DNA-binding domain-containing protein [Hymenobacter negativus]|uniref:DNA-binding domain-containing protein n=1 Tax=Hymenobacter negativus TaxID=2795026 RepID=A0ABS3QK14_9BACT|nr:DNA-binding domain-containing protein [Hymenobacter negativus]MBO2011596.1 putative DNA-binding domain-containing protein [Hymenobacter negativus]
MMVEASDFLPLPAFQQWMQQALLDPQQATAAEAVLNHSARLSAQEHLAIYQRSYMARLRGCMAQQFSALEYALGEELFRVFADDYLTAYPSRHYNLAELGRLFPAYLQSNRPDALSEDKEDWIDFIVELAGFEYALNVLFDQQAEENYHLAGLEDDESELALVPTCTLFRFQFPINTFYTQFKKGECPPLPFAGTSQCVVLRHEYQLTVYDIQPVPYEFLTLLATGMSVPAAQAAFSQRAPVTQLWPVWKKNWVEANLFRVRPKAG